MLTLDLPKNIEVSLQSIADARGMSVENLAMQLISHQLQENPFNFDLDEMKVAVESPRVEVPVEVMGDLESFEKWLKGAYK
ncbi:MULTISPECIES: hypothetical protein [unclassified Acinetobacter]|uniref:hypothetical protein n=1 Tax=unclassified Acinetobacter TaxID=196816 RepID=UPI0035B95BF8